MHPPRFKQTILHCLRYLNRRLLTRLFLLPFLFWTAPSHALEPLILTEAQAQYELSPHVEYLKDAAGTLSFEQAAAAQAYTQNTKAIMNFGFTPAVYWLRFRVHNPTQHVQELLLENSYPLIDHLDLYSPAINGKLDVQKNGDLLPFSHRTIEHKNLLFQVTVPPAETATFYLRAHTSSSMQLPLRLWSKSAFQAKDHKWSYFDGLIYGIFLAMLVYASLLYYSIREVNYLHYVHFIAAFSLFLLSLSGLAFEYLWPEYPNWGNTAVPFFIGLSLSGLCNFTRSFLETKHNQPIFDNVLLTLSVTLLAAAAGSLFFSYSIMIKITTATALVTGVSVFIGSVVGFKKSKQARNFLLAWFPFALGIVVYPLRAFGFLPPNYFTEYSIPIGFAIGAMLLPLALSNRMKFLQQENNRIQMEATKLLETRVAERTLELNTAMLRLAAANTSLAELNLVDSLTGAKNRQYLTESLSREWHLARRDQYPIALLIMDIDHFKNINDTHGHMAGDAVIKGVADTLKKLLKRPTDEVVRYGGEEFVIVLPHTTQENALQFAEQIRQEIATLAIPYETARIRLTISIGVAVAIPTEESHQDKLLAAADNALYEAKNAGRNCVIFHPVTANQAVH